MNSQAAPDNIFKCILFGVLGTYLIDDTVCPFCKAGLTDEMQIPENRLRTALSQVPGVSIRNLVCEPNGEFRTDGDLARFHPAGEPFVEGVLQELRVALQAAGFFVDACDADVDDEFFDGPDC